MESQLYGGPETVEHAFECEDDFQSVHVRRRDGTETGRVAKPRTHAQVWYTMVYDEASGEMRFQVEAPRRE